MFIGIAGPICSGKRTIANFLIANYGFTRLRLRSVNGVSSPSDEFDVSTPSQSETDQLCNEIKNVHVNGIGDICFRTMADMTDYVTKRWRENFVTVDIWNDEDLEIITKRPFFLLVSVDAPVTIRWKRFNERHFQFYLF